VRRAPHEEALLHKAANPPGPHPHLSTIPSRTLLPWIPRRPSLSLRCVPPSPSPAGRASTAASRAGEIIG
jgi:hypothetical protein